ncbi:hypothetical protein EI77_03110 [Prosthecobacter fusiformis]|uniref:Uncharacterized protein n=1 Tax=Prosthecobacter fusiformis TaxID=48464 RepID=A0A4R7RX50_9BACT|nr:hypothetical protein EI77_03110 [Prosthecobacter fusiformis]
MLELNHPGKIVFEILVGKVKAVVHRRRIGSTWVHTVNVIRCFEPNDYWSAEYGFLPSDVADIMEATVHARRWLRQHCLQYTVHLP